MLWTLLTWLLSLVAMIALGVTTITNSVKRLALSLSPPSNNNNNNSTLQHDPTEDLSLFIQEQKQKISKFMGEMKED